VVNYSKPCDLWDTLQVTKAQKFGGLSQKLSAFERKKERKNYLNHIYFQNLMELLDNFINIILMILLEELIKKRKYKIMG